MPKKCRSENTKAVEARLRKAEKNEEEKSRKEAEAEDALWQDDDKHVARKQQRKDDKEKKRVEQQERKQELRQLHDDEMDQMKGAKPQTKKLSRLDIDLIQQREADAAKRQHKDVEEPIVENVNRLVVEGDEGRTVEEAIAVLSVQPSAGEKHPEKRMKAAYLQFEEQNLPVLKKENPNLRLSQLKQMLKKDWMKSPDNPVNQRSISYNEKK